MDSFAERIELFLQIAWRAECCSDYESWARRVESFLASSLGTEAAEAFLSLGGEATESDWAVYRDRQTGHLEGLVMRVESTGLAESRASAIAAHSSMSMRGDSRKVFLVHGRDGGTKEMVARFVERLGLEPIILHEQANEGRTVIEKFEAHADVPFAVVLMTADDTGGLAGDSHQFRPRARQNVILELGYFTGKLGRSRVSALFSAGLELPSDLHGVLFIELDEGGAWRMKLAQELVTAGLKPRLEALVGS